MRLAAVTVAAVSLALAAPAAGAARSVAAPGPVRALSLTGYEVAFAAEAGRGCTEVRVWDTADRGVRRYGRHCFPATSTGSGVAAVAVAGRRALWLSYTGGNVREWSLWTASRTAPAPRRIRFAAADVAGPAPILVGQAAEHALVYAVDRTVIALQPSGARLFVWEAPERVTDVSAGTTGYAVVLAGGDVATLNRSGAVVRRHTFPRGEVLAATLGAPGLIVHLRGSLLVRRDGDRRLPLPAGARFHGFAQGAVAYSTNAELRLLRLADGRDVPLRRVAAAGSHAALGRLGLARAAGRTVSFEAWPVVAGRLQARR
jgi:hypothetical protein